MSIPKLFPVRELKKKAKKQGIIWDKSKGKGGHGAFVGPDTKGNIQVYPLPSSQHKKEVTSTYLRGFLRRFCLNEEFLDN